MSYEYWLATLPIHNKEKIALIEELQEAREVFFLPEEQLRSYTGLRPAAKDILLDYRKKEDWKREEEQVRKEGVRWISWQDASYPLRLRTIYNPPYNLFYKGTLPVEKQKRVALVGARSCSSYGKTVAETLSQKLAEAGICVVSGMATGIDGASHRGALPAQRDFSFCKTLAVLGCGVLVCYPAVNRRLYQEIMEQGGVLSEYPPYQQPLKQLFPHRNRLISGLSDVCVIVEAREKSGSLITADCALEQGKSIYAVPGRLGDSLSFGTNWLLSQGAAPLYSVDEFLRDLGVNQEQNAKKNEFSENSLEKDETIVYSMLDLTEKHFNELLEEGPFSFSELMKILAQLQKKHLIQEVYKNYYIRTGI